MNNKFEALTAALVAAWNAGDMIPVPPAEEAPRNRRDAYDIQDRFAQILGDRCIGWKVGAAVPAVQTMEGHDGPIPGRLFASRQFESPAKIPAALVGGYKVECEFAFRFKDAVPARQRPYTRQELEANLVFHPGLEIAGHRYRPDPSGRKATTHDLIADNGACGAYVETEGIEDWDSIDFARVAIDARIDGGDRIQQFSGELYRDPVDVLVETVNDLSTRGIGINAGDILTTGSLTLPTPIQQGQTFVARFGNFATLEVSLV